MDATARALDDIAFQRKAVGCEKLSRPAVKAEHECPWSKWPLYPEPPQRRTALQRNLTK